MGPLSDPFTLPFHLPFLIVVELSTRGQAWRAVAHEIFFLGN